MRDGTTAAEARELLPREAPPLLAPLLLYPPPPLPRPFWKPPPLVEGGSVIVGDE